jgi:hypothetical protein
MSVRSSSELFERREATFVFEVATTISAKKNVSLTARKAEVALPLIRT